MDADAEVDSACPHPEEALPGDPDLHTHVAVANKVQPCRSGLVKRCSSVRRSAPWPRAAAALPGPCRRPSGLAPVANFTRQATWPPSSTCARDGGHLLGLAPSAVAFGRRQPHRRPQPPRSLCLAAISTGRQQSAGVLAAGERGEAVSLTRPVVMRCVPQRYAARPADMVMSTYWRRTSRTRARQPLKIFMIPE